ncbi:MBL fold metallo-hydrolase [Streptomyces sp. NBC_01361]|uniref:MBL fold metallo-hydrolase n=1 Tax=Streptomyces sp. NBC_01361 TaxID=2903838 RepID=UPI002E3788DB|nr:MBL fold metallo-hydrolase [Streptomyces sp. NBC_01361]
MTESTRPAPHALIELGGGLYLWDTHAPAGTWGNANCLLIADGEEAGLVDTPYDAPLTEALKSACAKVLPSGVAITTVINTHPNGDHCFGNGQFEDAEIFSSEANADHICLEPDPEAMHWLIHGLPESDPLRWFARERFGRYQFAGITVKEPTRTFSGFHTLTIGGLHARLIEVGPAHTPGDIIVHIPERGVVAAGDVIFNGDHPCHWIGPLENVIEAVKAILVMEPVTVVPGHGRAMTVADGGVHAYLDYLRELADRIREQHVQGRTAYDAARAILDTGFYSHLGAPERVVILTAVEFAHLDGTKPPGTVDLARQAARWAYERHTEIPGPRTDDEPSDSRPDSHSSVAENP